MAVEVIDKIKPKNGGSFPIVEAIDVEASEGVRLPEALAAKADTSALAATNAAVALKADTTVITELQNQVDQIVISAAAETVVAPEVAQARVGDNGTEYNTLKARLDAENTSIIGDLDSAGIRRTVVNYANTGIIDNGELKPSYTNFKCTDAIPASGAIIFSGPLGLLDSSHYYVHCYDADDEYLGGLIAGDSNHHDYSNEKITLISGTASIIICNHVNSISRGSAFLLSHGVLLEIDTLKTDINDINSDITQTNTYLDDAGISRTIISYSRVGIIDSNGDLQPSYTNFKATSSIAVSGTILFSGPLGLLDSSHYYIHCYDDNEYLGGLIAGDNSRHEYTDKSIELIEGTTNIVICNHVNAISIGTASIVDHGVLLEINYVKGDIVNITSDIAATNSNVENLEQKTGIRHYDLNYSRTGFIDSSGEIQPSYNKFKSTNIIPASGAIIFSGPLGLLDSSHYYVHCYDADDEYLGGLVAGDNAIHDYSDERIDLIEGTAGIAFSNHVNAISRGSSSMETLGEISRIPSLEKSRQELENNQYLDLSAFSKFGVVGDSLSVGYMWNDYTGAASDRNIYYSWGQYIARKNGNVCLNFGFSGATTGTWFSNSTHGKVELEQSENLCQCYIVGIGTNDTGDIGDIDDIDWGDYTQNADTFYGRFARILQFIRSTAEKAPIFVLTLPYPRESATKNAAMKEIVNSGNITNAYIVDLTEFNDIFKNNIYNYYSHQHFTAVGYKHCATIIEIAASNVMKANISDFNSIAFIPFGDNDIIE